MPAFGKVSVFLVHTAFSPAMDAFQETAKQNLGFYIHALLSRVNNLWIEIKILFVTKTFQAKQVKNGFRNEQACNKLAWKKTLARRSAFLCSILEDD